MNVRDQFPILDQEGAPGQPLVFLDSAASSQRPQAVLDAIQHYETHLHANVHRGVHLLSRRATEAYEAARADVARFLNAPSVDEIVFTRGTTEALNLVAHTWGQSLGEGDEIVLTAMEHHSNIVPWQLVAQRTGAVIRVVPVLPDGSLDMDAYRALLGPKTQVVSMVHVSNALGTINPVREICRLAHEHGAIAIIDGAQAVPHQPVDVQELGADFYAFSGHKMYGPTGIGVLWGRMSLLSELPPWQGGGDMIETVSFDGSTWAAPPARFEAGTPNIAGAVGLGAAVRWMESVGREAIAAHEAELLRVGTAGMLEIPGVHLVGTAADKAGVISFLVDGLHAHDVGTLLDEQGIAVRTGHHCTMPLLAALGIDATARASFGAYNTLDDVERFLAGVRKVLLFA